MAENGGKDEPGIWLDDSTAVHQGSKKFKDPDDGYMYEELFCDLDEDHPCNAKDCSPPKPIQALP